jgi:hypothetical protein
LQSTSCMQGTSHTHCIVCHLILTTLFVSRQSGPSPCSLSLACTSLPRYKHLVDMLWSMSPYTSQLPHPPASEEPSFFLSHYIFPFTLTDLKFHECDQCKELFPTPALLQVHIKCQHSGQSPFCTPLSTTAWVWVLSPPLTATHPRLSPLTDLYLSFFIWKRRAIVVPNFMRCHLWASLKC